MSVANYEIYCKMLDRARERRFAYPAINVTSLTTANAVLRGFAESKSDGIIQVSTGGGAFASGSIVKDMAIGAISIAEHVHRVAERYPIYVALHTDHCQADKLDTFVIPLVEETERRRAAGRATLFNSHMFDGSNLPLKENLDIAVKLLERFQKNQLVLEIEAGVVGGEEDGVTGKASEKLYTTPEDILEVAGRLNAIKGARYLLAATFGNVHGVYKPGHVRLKPTVPLLQAKGCPCLFQELEGGHNWTNWRAHLKDLLTFLRGKEKVESAERTPVTKGARPPRKKQSSKH
jgi:fructose-bisphosphate aldolase class II